MRHARHHSTILLLAIASTVAGCGRGGGGDIHKDDPGHAGGAGAGDGTTTAGSRLVPLSYQGSDGSKTFAGLFDKKLGKECTFDRLGALGVCVPRDVYAIDAQLFYATYENGNPALYVDPACDERKAIALDEGADCTRYGVIRISGNPYATSDTPGCGHVSFGAGLAVVTPVPAGTKVYAYRVPEGGGACCTCSEWTPPEGSGLRAYLLEINPAEVDTGKIALVTGTIDYPSAP